ncbi:hypothetical protein N7462_001951 [Penicillium macrosclerotiorum]|uniref:uncharacterized protein n=1 Tax=Penicillium macrosclerotiorum TaxID=303699 RepID=UPI002546A802|nr:uncharacterized protein N7462_001951 [Penicillium macrosclerotiorum]KAJ5692528.1 hypothetical protein N7462_001951 [Penicillium macrosclerotiorum]
MKVLIVTTIFTSLAALFVAIRIWTRIGIVKSPGYDDLLIFAAVLSSILFYAFILVERHYGLGVPVNLLPQHVIEGQLRYLWLSVPFYNLSLCLSKLSALVLYTRIFRNRRFLITTYLSMAFIIISGLWMVGSGFIFCVPVRAFWSLDHQYHISHCLPEGPIWFSNAGIQIFTDVIILILPMPLLSRLNLPTRQKAGLMFVFGLGIFVVATSSARLYELSTMVRGQDFTRKNADAAVWSSLEANVSIICACMPPIHPLISRIFSFCFRPQPLHSSPASKLPSNTTHLASSRKHSVHDQIMSPDGGIFYNDIFFAGPGSYTASISNMNTNKEEPDTSRDGIKVVRELRMVSDTMNPNLDTAPNDIQDRDFELESGLGTSFASAGNASWSPSIEWDLGDFEFPDYKERMNAPL